MTQIKSKKCCRHRVINVYDEETFKAKCVFEMVFDPLEIPLIPPSEKNLAVLPNGQNAKCLKSSACILSNNSLDYFRSYWSFSILHVSKKIVGGSASLANMTFGRRRKTGGATAAYTQTLSHFRAQDSGHRYARMATSSETWGLKFWHARLLTVSHVFHVLPLKTPECCSGTVYAC